MAAASREGDEPSDVELPAYLPNEPGIKEDIAAMHGVIRAIDDAVGTITTALERTQFVENTLFRFTIEHGITFPRVKGPCYHPVIEAALLMRYPGVIVGGHAVSDS